MPFLKQREKITRSQKLENLTKKNGLRHAIFTIWNDKYIGEWKDDKKDGKGSYFSRSNIRYDGDWMENYRHGFGVLSYKMDNNVYYLNYRGDWKYGRASGFGERHYPDGSYYKGFFLRSKRHGYGQMWYPDGAFYDGDWVRDKRDGLGMLVNKDGNRYEGGWKKDMKHGDAVYFHLDSGQMQEGIWVEDNCVCSTVVDLAFRQTSVSPTRFTIQYLELVNQNIYEEQKEKALAGKINSCLWVIGEDSTADGSTSTNSMPKEEDETKKSVSI